MTMDNTQENGTDPGDQLARAEAAHRAGDRATAERLYRTVLNGNPEAAPALYFYGVLLLQCGRTGEAEAFLRRAPPMPASLVLTPLSGFFCPIPAV